MCIRDRRITDPDVALVELHELFETFAVDLRVFAKQQQDKEEVSQKLQKQQKVTPSSASVIGSSLWYALAFPVELASWSSRLFISNATTNPTITNTTTPTTAAVVDDTIPSQLDPQDRSPSEHQREAANDKENAAALAGALSRMVVLLSQQSVLALPYELFVRQFVDSDQLNGDAIYVGETRDDDNSSANDACVRCGMRANVQWTAGHEGICQVRLQK
eukprot:TRINITY_DN24998_c0_g1_i1.p1 TRINITY_DN24998_c0_g1~~TRINITY_DN24998_c0_g1_i1.p1  ORF type:complete len:218 (+),score=28.34 TRINITY_DN24998_c0_g1_i1:144-797(+)